MFVVCKNIYLREMSVGRVKMTSDLTRRETWVSGVRKKMSTSEYNYKLCDFAPIVLPMLLLQILRIKKVKKMIKASEIFAEILPKIKNIENKRARNSGGIHKIAILWYFEKTISHFTWHFQPIGAKDLKFYFSKMPVWLRDLSPPCNDCT